MNVAPNLRTKTERAGRRPSAGLLRDIVRLTQMAPPAAQYFQEFVQRIVAGLPALAGVLWLKTPEGQLQAHGQANVQHIRLEQGPSGRRIHQELLRQALAQGRPLQIRPQDWAGTSALPSAAATTEVSEEVLVVPIKPAGEVLGLLELWRPSEGSDAPPWPIGLLCQLAELAASYLQRLATATRNEPGHLWSRLEHFAREVHRSLDPMEVAYTTANEGRALIDCDRLSVGLRQGRTLGVAAVSGVDVIDQRSNLVRGMRGLFDAVLNWGDRLVYTGVRDDSLPRHVLQALDRYLDESGARLVALLPLKDERSDRQRPRSGLLLECFEPVATPETLLARLDVVGRHGASALANAVEYRRIPLRFLWRPIAALQEGLGGKAKALMVLLAGAAGLLVYLLCFVPYPLKLDAKGQLVPEERHWLYSPVEGQVVRFEDGLQPGSSVAANQSLVLLYDVQLEIKMIELANDVAAAQQAIEALLHQENGASADTERLRFSAERKQKEFLRDRKMLELRALRERTHADESRPGAFWLTAPCNGTILNSGFREAFTHRCVKPSEPLLRIGDKSKRWEIDLQIPQQHIAQVLGALGGDDAELDVELMLLSCPTRVFRGKLPRGRLAGQATPNRDEPGNVEPVVEASVRIDGPGIGESERIPQDLLVTGTEVRAKIRCGDRAMGYSLFHGVWEFFNEKVLFVF